MGLLEMDSTSIAQILWATTGDFLPIGSSTATADARMALAVILAAGIDKGFPAPLEPTQTDRNSQGWKECSAAAVQATSAAPAVPPAAFALLTTVKVAGGTALDSDLDWPDAAGTKISARIGPLRRKSDARDWYLVTFAVIDPAALTVDGDAAPGLFPRASAKVAMTGAGGGNSPSQPTNRAKLLSVAMFLTAIALSLLSIAVTYGASRLIAATIERMAASEVSNTVCKVALSASENNSADRLESVRDACATPWATAWEDGGNNTANWWARTLDSALWKVLNVNKSASLIAPLLLSYLAIIVLIVASGMATRGTWLGALVDNRNRISLSRVQMLLWTIVLLGGYIVLATFNIALLGGAMRDLTLSAAAGSAKAKATLEQFVGYFPSMDSALWAVLGLTVAVSPYLSQVILNQKNREGGDAGVDYRRAEVRTLIEPSPLEMRAPGLFRWADLITGEEEANAAQVDVSRLQYLVITFLLLGGYLILLLTYARSLDGTQILIAVHDNTPVFPSMPAVDATFLGLLVLSHGGYLAFKALPAKGTGGVTG